MRWLIGAGYRHRYFRLDPDVLHVTQLSLRCLADAPHRLYFFLGAVNLLTASIWWFLATILREIQPGLLATSVGLSTQLHPLVMIYGFFPFYIFGFTFTAGPRWLGMPPPARREYLWPGVGMALAFLALYPALFVGEIAVVAALALYAACAGLLWLRFSVLIGRSQAVDRVHARVVQLSLAIGGITLVIAVCMFATGNNWRDLARSAGIWGFLVPLFCTVCHHMLPFFVNSLRNPSGEGALESASIRSPAVTCSDDDGEYTHLQFPAIHSIGIGDMRNTAIATNPNAPILSGHH